VPSAAMHACCGGLYLGHHLLSSVTVLPLPFLPEQSVSHYAAHVVYTLGQVPLVLVSYRAARWAAERSRRSTDAPAQ
jgi:hypothetical protein